MIQDIQSKGYYDELPWPTIHTDFIEHTLTELLSINYLSFPIGTVVRLKQTSNFGWIQVVSIPDTDMNTYSGRKFFKI